MRRAKSTGLEVARPTRAPFAFSVRSSGAMPGYTLFSFQPIGLKRSLNSASASSACASVMPHVVSNEVSSGGPMNFFSSARGGTGKPIFSTAYWTQSPGRKRRLS